MFKQFSQRTGEVCPAPVQITPDSHSAFGTPCLKEMSSWPPAGAAKQDVVLRPEHKAGEKLFVDLAGTAILIYDPKGDPGQRADLFVA